MKERSNKTLVRSTLAGHVKNMGDEKLAQRADAQKVEGKRKTGIAMGDCIKHDPDRVGEEWKTLTDRRNWSLLTENVVREK